MQPHRKSHCPRFLILDLYLYEQKNAPGKVIILYDEDERIAADCASTFVQREVNNVFMLSGGKLVYTGVRERVCVSSCGSDDLVT